MTKKVQGWWISPPGGKLGYTDGRTPKKGETHSISKHRPLKQCAYGLHASVQVTDAMLFQRVDSFEGGKVGQYFIGHPTGRQHLWRVELTDPNIAEDKMYSYQRKYLFEVEDPDQVLLEFGFDEAFKVIDKLNIEVPKKLLHFLEEGGDTDLPDERDIIEELTMSDTLNPDGRMWRTEDNDIRRLYRLSDTLREMCWGKTYRFYRIINNLQDLYYRENNATYRRELRNLNKVRKESSPFISDLLKNMDRELQHRVRQAMLLEIEDAIYKRLDKALIKAKVK